jgi:3-oxoacyl-[acyl-carrier-protein] synthase II
VSVFDASRQRVKLAAEVDLPATLPKTKLNAREEKRLERAGRMLLLALNEAWKQSGFAAGAQIPMVLGTTSGGMPLGEDYYRQAINSPQSQRRQPTRVLHYQAQIQAQTCARAMGFHGPITIIANACASGANAIGHAYSLVRNGQVKQAVAGGYDGLSHLVFAGFDSLQALSMTSCRPFDANRDGLGLGEGAAVLALETLESAQRRGAEILGELAGYGASMDIHHLTQPHPNGDAAFESMQAACAQARVAAEHIGYINAHGTGTALNDSAEAAAINRWANGHAVAVSSTKASIGHLLGAAGAVEAMICVMALREQWLPPTRTIQEPDPICKFPIVREPREQRFEYALSNSFGFGGANASLIFRRWA